MPVQVRSPRPLFTKADAIFSVGAICYWLALLAVFVFGYIAHALGFFATSNDGLEAGDKIAFLVLTAAVLITALVLFSSRLRGLQAWVTSPACQWICITMFLWATIATPTHVSNPLVGFTGFGVSVSLAMILALPVTLLVLARHPLFSWIDRQATGALSLAGLGLSLLVCFIYLPDLIQPIWGLHEPSHASYFLNELLGPITGSYPLVDYVAQYTNLLGFFFAGLGIIPFVLRYPLIVAPLFVSSLAIATIALAVASIARLLPRGKRWLSVVLIVPLALVGSQAASSPVDTIAFHFAILPGRLLFPVLLGFVLTQLRFRITSVLAMIILGAYVGMATLNNFESGLATGASVLLVLFLIGKNGSQWIKRLLAFFVGISLPFALYAGIFALQGTPIHPSWYFLFGASFSKGFAALPTPLIGFHLVIFPFALCIFFVTMFFCCRQSGRLRECLQSSDDNISIQATANLLALFYASFILIMSPYFLARSSLWGQLQSFFLPFAVCVAACFVHWLRTDVSFEREAFLPIGAVPFLTVALSSSLAISSIILHPDLLAEIQRIFPTSIFITAFNGLPGPSSTKIDEFRLSSINKKLFPPMGQIQVEGQIVLSDFPNMRNAEDRISPVRYVLPLNTFRDAFITAPAITSVFCSRVKPLLDMPTVEVLPSAQRVAILDLCSSEGASPTPIP